MKRFLLILLAMYVVMLGLTFFLSIDHLVK